MQIVFYGLTVQANYLLGLMTVMQIDRLCKLSFGLIVFANCLLLLDSLCKLSSWLDSSCKLSPRARDSSCKFRVLHLCQLSSRILQFMKIVFYGLEI